MSKINDWRETAAAKAVSLISAGGAVFTHINEITERVRAESEILDREKITLEKLKREVDLRRPRRPHETADVDLVERQEMVVARCKARLDALLQDRDELKAKHELLRLATEAKNLSKIFDLEAL